MKQHQHEGNEKAWKTLKEHHNNKRTRKKLKHINEIIEHNNKKIIEHKKARV